MVRPSTDTEREIIARITKFATNAKSLIERITPESLIEEGGVNPYLVKALGMTTIDEVVEFFGAKRVERSLGTSFGKVLEDVLRITLNGKSGKEVSKERGWGWIKWWDIVLVDRKVVMSVKSGPADMDKDQIGKFADYAREAVDKGFYPFLVFAYGKKAFSVISDSLKKYGFPPEKHLRIGKDIFKEFMNEPEYHKRLLELFGTAAFKTEGIFDLVEEKINKLIAELKKEYGDDLQKMLEDMF